MLRPVIALVGSLILGAHGYSNTWNKVETTQQVSPPRIGYAIARINDKFVLTGGWDQVTEKAHNDIWTSTDLVDWELQGEAEWEVRSEHSMTEHDGFLWVMGGRDAKGVTLADTWKSGDGITWTMVASGKDRGVITYNARARSQSFSVDGNLIMQGGVKDQSLYGLRSVGLLHTEPEWSLPFQNDTLPYRYDAAVVHQRFELPTPAPWEKTPEPTDPPADATEEELKSLETGEGITWYDEVLVLGGQGSNPDLLDDQGTYEMVYYNDIYKTRDGRSYELVLAEAPWSPRSRAAVAQYAGRIFLVGGFDGKNSLNDVWSSSDAILWDLENSGADFAPRNGHHAFFIGCTLKVVFGESEPFEYLPKVRIDDDDGTRHYYRGEGASRVNTILNEVWTNDHCVPKAETAPLISGASPTNPTTTLTVMVVGSVAVAMSTLSQL